jgi:hypothetical protein
MAREEVAIPAGQGAAITNGIAAKRDLNRPYGGEVEAGRRVSLQAFMAAGNRSPE